MKKTTLMAALAMAIPVVANATGAAAGSHDFTSNWPTWTAAGFADTILS